MGKRIGKFTLTDLVGVVEITPKSLCTVILRNCTNLRLLNPLTGKIYRNSGIPYATIDTNPERARPFYSDKGGSLQELFEAVREELEYMYRAYGLAKDNELSPGARKLKVWIRRYAAER